MRAETLRLFATPVAIAELDGMEAVNVELTDRLVRESRETPGVSRSNAGGWHSVPDLARRGEGCYRRLFQALVDRLAVTIADLAREAGSPPPPPLGYTLHGWAMVMRDGDYTVPHDHGDCHFSSAYYADAGDADLERHPTSGHLGFMDPRRGSPAIDGVDLSPSTLTIRPRTGMLVLFPGSLQHFVHPYRGTRPRVAIACNVTVQRSAAGPLVR